MMSEAIAVRSPSTDGNQAKRLLTILEQERQVSSMFASSSMKLFEVGGTAVRVHGSTWRANVPNFPLVGGKQP